MAELLDGIKFDFQDTGTGERGCGKGREEGALYAVTKLGYGPGPSWRTLLIDPPEPITAQMIIEMGIGAQGVSMRDRALKSGNIAHDIWDWVGAGSGPNGIGYWNTADHVEEGLNHPGGFSGKLPVHGVDWTQIKLGEGEDQSFRYLIHPKAIVTNADALWKHRITGGRYSDCITDRPDHLAKPHPDFCDSLWWETIEGGLPLSENPADRRVIRTIGSLSYPAWRAPEGFVPEYMAGIFMRLPFTLEIVLDPQGKRHETVAEILEKYHQPYKFSET